MSLTPGEWPAVESGLIEIPREMNATILRTAYSTIVRDSNDNSAALLDPAGQLIVQAETCPIHVGGFTTLWRELNSVYNLQSLGPDEVVLTNDPFSGGQHLPDFLVLSPIHWDGRAVAFAVNLAHHLDVGGGEPGINPSATEIYAEGIRVPPIKLNLREDWVNGLLGKLLCANVRMPRTSIGDLNAQFAANYVGTRRFADLVKAYGMKTVQKVVTDLLDGTEARVRELIRKHLRPGIYKGQAILENAPNSPPEVRIACTVTVKQNKIQVDFTESDRQFQGPGNCSQANAISATIMALRLALPDPDLAINAGFFRCVETVLQLGSVVNPHLPAAFRTRMNTSYRVMEAVLDALDQATDGGVVAEGYDTTTTLVFSVRDPVTKEYRLWSDVLGGGYGAGPLGPGDDALDSILSNCTNVPIEMVEQAQEYFRVSRYAVWSGSGGAGLHLGGSGIEREYEILRDGVLLTTYGDRFRHPARGRRGGQPGAPGSFTVLRGERGQVNLLPLSRTELKAGDRLLVRVGGGGGFGLATRPE